MNFNLSDRVIKMNKNRHEGVEEDYLQKARGCLGICKAVFSPNKR